MNNVCVVVNDQPYDQIFGSDNKDNIYIIKLRGKKAYTGYHSLIAAALMGHYGYVATELLQIYRFEKPGEWYFMLAPLAAQRKDPHGTSFIHKDLEGEIFDLKKRDITTFLHWAPPTINEETVRVLATKVLKKPFIVSKSRGATDRWILVHEADEQMPHYIEVNAKAPNGNIRNHIFMLTQAGRRQACRHCSSQEHWTTACPTKTRRTQESGPQRTKQPLTPRSQPATISTPTKNNP